MAPDIALSKIKDLTEDQIVLDPMAGSGMVLGQAARNGIRSIGYDLDPLAQMVSRAGATRLNSKLAECALSQLIEKCKKTRRKNIKLDWIDGDEETAAFVNYWFDNKQQHQLRLLSFYLFVDPVVKNKKVLEILKVSISRLIITKEPKASLARDTAHSRPHRTILENNFDIFEELPKSLDHVLKALDSSTIQVNAKTYLGDARKMTRIKDETIDSIVTSPPYLNAIDYIRGHRLSLVWFGYTLDQLRTIRRTSIGSEMGGIGKNSKEFKQIINQLELDVLNDRNLKMLDRYFFDLTMQLKESFRVLKYGSKATYVIGNSTLKGCFIKNSELLKIAGNLVGFVVDNETVREIPDNRRYLPMAVDKKNTLAKRMRTENIIEFVKVA
jgi:DNA modification methylase